MGSLSKQCDKSWGGVNTGSCVDAQDRHPAGSWGLGNAFVCVQGERRRCLQSRQGIAPGVPAPSPTPPAGLPARSPERSVSMSVPSTERGQGGEEDVSLRGFGVLSTAEVTCMPTLAGGRLLAAASRQVPVGCWPVVASSREHEQCIPARCLTHAWFRSLKRWENSHNNRKRGPSSWLTSGEQKGLFPNRLCSSEGVTTATRNPEPPGWLPGKMDEFFLGWKNELMPGGPRGTILLCSFHLLGQAGSQLETSFPFF